MMDEMPQVEEGSGAPPTGLDGSRDASGDATEADGGPIDVSVDSTTQSFLSPSEASAQAALNALFEHGMLQDSPENRKEYNQLIGTPEGQTRLLELYQTMNEAYSEDAAKIREELIDPESGVIPKQFLEKFPGAQDLVGRLNYDQLKQLQNNMANPDNIKNLLGSILKVNRADEITPEHPFEPVVDPNDIENALVSLRNQTLDSLAETLATTGEHSKEEYLTYFDHILRIAIEAGGLIGDLAKEGLESTDINTFLLAVFLGSSAGYNSWQGGVGKERGQENRIGVGEFKQWLKEKDRRRSFLEKFAEAYKALSKRETTDDFKFELENSDKLFSDAVEDDNEYIKIFEKLIKHMYENRETSDKDRLWSIFSNTMGNVLRSGSTLDPRVRVEVFDKLEKLQSSAQQSDRAEFLSFFGLRDSSGE